MEEGDLEGASIPFGLFITQGHQRAPWTTQPLAFIYHLSSGEGKETVELFWWATNKWWSLKKTEYHHEFDFVEG